MAHPDALPVEETRRITRRRFGQMLAGFGVLLTVPGFASGASKRLLVGVSSETLAGANMTDARAAAKVWAEQITRDLDISVAEMYPDVFIPSAQMVRMIQEGAIDLFVLTALEYAKVATYIDPECVLVESKAPDGLEYVLVVHSASPFQKIEDLRKRQLTFHHHRDTVLLTEWISVQLAKGGQGTIDSFFASMISRESLTQVVAPLFFRRTDVAGLTNIAFRVAAELNPQLGKDLRVLAVSPKIVPEVFCFRRGVTADQKRRLMNTFLRVKTVTAGQQILALYQTEGYEQRTAAVMQGTVDMVHEYERIAAGASAKKRRA